MKRLFGYIKATVIGGFVVVLPIAIVVVMLAELSSALLGLLDPLIESLPIEALGGIVIATLVAIIIVLAFCFLTGLLVQIQLGAYLRDRMESILLNRVPGYTLLKQLTQRFTGMEGIQFTPALVDLHATGAQVLGLIVEKHDDGSYTIFVPFSPTPTLGQVYYLPGDRVQPADISLAAAVDDITMWGTKSKQLFGNR